MTGGEGQGPGSQSDHEALGRLSAAYAAAVDNRDGVGFAALFVASGELLVPDVPGDLRPVVSRAGHEVLRRVPDGLRRYDRTLHQVSNHLFSVDGDRAPGDVQCVAHHVAVAGARSGAEADGDGASGRATETATGSAVAMATDTASATVKDTVWFIRYRDDYVRTTDGWRFERRALHLQWIEEHPVSVLPPGPIADRS